MMVYYTIDWFDTTVTATKDIYGFPTYFLWFYGVDFCGEQDLFAKFLLLHDRLLSWS